MVEDLSVVHPEVKVFTQVALGGLAAESAALVIATCISRLSV